MKWIVYPGQECRRNLSRLRDVAQAWRDHAEQFPAMDQPSQAECWQLLKMEDPTITRVDCPLIHDPINAYWHTSGPRTPDPHAPYVINPRLFTRPTSEWLDSDVVAADSRPRHIATTEGPGIWSVLLVRWDRSIHQAYFRGDQSPSLIQHLDDFAAGIDRRDGDEAWLPFYDWPTLNLATECLRTAWHLAAIVVLAAVWVRLYRKNTSIIVAPAATTKPTYVRIDVRQS